MKVIIAVVCVVLFCGWLVSRAVQGIQFDRACEGYLKRAADANTVELAIKNLQVALEYAKCNGLTQGYTSVLYRTPDEDVEFWYKNLEASLQELQAITPTTTQLERTNVLMKLRETLLDQGRHLSITTPSGISVYPSNQAYAWWGWLSVGVLILTVLSVFLEDL